MEDRYISYEEVENQLGVTRATLHYYIRILSIERKKFPLDKRAYMRVADFERIQRLREAGRGSGQRSGDEDAA